MIPDVLDFEIFNINILIVADGFQRVHILDGLQTFTKHTSTSSIYYFRDF